jgi:golgin subfamily A member 4
MYELKIKELLSEFQDQRDNLIKERDADQLELQEFERKYEELKDKYDSLEFDHREEIDSLLAKIDDLETKVVTYENSLQERKAEYLKEIENQKIKFMQENSKLSHEVQRITSESEKTIESIRQSWKEENKALGNRNDQLNAANRALKSQLEEIDNSGSFNEYKLQLEKLAEDMKTVKKRAKEDINQLQEDNQKVAQENEKWRQTIQELQEKVERQKELLKSTQQQVKVNKSLKDDTADARDELESKMGYFKYLNDQKENTINRLQNDYDMLKRQIEEENSKHEEEISHMRLSMTNQNDKIK